MVAAEAEGKGEGLGQQAVVRRRADPFNIADVMAGVDLGKGESMVANILVVSEDDGEGARRIMVEGGPAQPEAPNVAAAAMKSILCEVQRQEEGKGGRGQPAAGAAGSEDSSVPTGGRGRTGKGVKGQAGTPGAGQAKGHQARKGGKGSGRGRQWPQPKRSFRQSPPGSRPQVSAAVRAEEEREERYGTRRWRTWSASAVATSPRSRDRTPSTGWRRSRGGQGRGVRGSWRGREGSTPGSPGVGCREREGRQNRAAQQWRGTAASARESKRVGASDVDTQAVRCRAGVRDK